MCASIKSGKDIHADEVHYHQYKDLYDIQHKKYLDGKISKAKWEQFLNVFTELEELYG